MRDMTSEEILAAIDRAMRKVAARFAAKAAAARRDDVAAREAAERPGVSARDPD